MLKVSMNSMIDLKQNISFFTFEALTDWGYIMPKFSMVNFLVSFGGKIRRKETTRKIGHTWEDGIKINVKEVGWEGMDWIHLSQGREQWRDLGNIVLKCG
jgi:hypothetical protein